jgi:hypothetical protein
MSSEVDRGLLTASVASARVSDQLWINFVTGAIRGTSLQESLIDHGNLEAARIWGQVKQATKAGLGAVYKRGAIRMCKHPFDFRSGNAEYHNGGGGEWRILRDGRLYKTDPNKIDEPTAWTEPTPFDALDAVEQMTITQTADEDTIFGLCPRFTGTAFGAATPVPQIWQAMKPLAVEALVDRHGMLRRVDIEVAGKDYRLGTTLTLEYRPHPQTVAPGQQT